MSSSSEPKLYVFPGGRRGVGPVHLTKRLIRCRACGNTRIFVGRALVYPRILVERMDQYQYEVVEISYQSTPNVDEVIERCAACGSTRIEVIPISEQALVDQKPNDKPRTLPPRTLFPEDDIPF